MSAQVQLSKVVNNSGDASPCSVLSARPLEPNKGDST